MKHWSLASRMSPLCTLCLMALAPAVGHSQTEPLVGLRDNPTRVHALVGARLVVEPGVEIESATVVIRNGIIAAVGADVVPPPDARV